MRCRGVAQVAKSYQSSRLQVVYIIFREPGLKDHAYIDILDLGP